MFSYDSRYHPPAPVLPVQISRPFDAASVTVQGFLDTGADMSVIPNSAVRDLRLQPVSVTLSRGFHGSVNESTVFSASLSLVPEDAKAVRVLCWNEDYALVGRDLINGWKVVLDGPARSWSLSR